MAREHEREPHDGGWPTPVRTHSDLVLSGQMNDDLKDEKGETGPCEQHGWCCSSC